MPDHLTPSQRHANMAAIRAKDTKPEVLVRKYLWRHGFRYRLNHKRLPGSPDIVMRRLHTIIMVNGCFWHKHDCPRFVWPSSNEDYWKPKILRNVEHIEESQLHGRRALMHEVPHRAGPDGDDVRKHGSSGVVTCNKGTYSSN